MSIPLVDHPIDFARFLQKEYARQVGMLFQDLSFNFEAYNRVNGDYHDISRRSHTNVMELDQIPFWKKSLHADQELGVCSNLVFAGGVPHHFLMADLVTSSEPAAWKMAQKVAQNPWVYNSGRSFHVYWPEIVVHKDWESFLKKLKKYPEVDKQWVKCAQDQTYGVLRWSNNTPHHPTMPVRVFSKEHLRGALSLADVDGGLALVD